MQERARVMRAERGAVAGEEGRRATTVATAVTARERVVWSPPTGGYSEGEELVLS